MKGEHCLGGGHGNQANAKHPKNSSDHSAWTPEGLQEWMPWDLQDPNTPHSLTLNEGIKQRSK